MKVSSNRTIPQVIGDELQEVQNLLNEVAGALHFPLNSLVHAQIQSAQPYVRASVVLATACTNDVDEPLRSQRIHLAAALETLYVALNVHKSLLTSSVESLALAEKSTDGTTQQLGGDTEIAQTDKLVMGSTILAGDYCFSRSAAMATKTGDPVVVDIFSEALKRVSEDHLRSIFDESVFSPTEDETLLLAGVQTSAQLLQLPEAVNEALTVLCKQLTKTLNSEVGGRVELLDTLDTYSPLLSSLQTTRWREIIVWLTA